MSAQTCWSRVRRIQRRSVCPKRKKGRRDSPGASRRNFDCGGYRWWCFPRSFADDVIGIRYTQRSSGGGLWWTLERCRRNGTLPPGYRPTENPTTNISPIYSRSFPNICDAQPFAPAKLINGQQPATECLKHTLGAIEKQYHKFASCVFRPVPLWSFHRGPPPAYPWCGGCRRGSSRRSLGKRNVSGGGRNRKKKGVHVPRLSCMHALASIGEISWWCTNGRHQPFTVWANLRSECSLSLLSSV